MRDAAFSRREYLKMMAASTAVPALMQARLRAQAATAPSDDARMAWWRDARFGMFIHWGLYAVAAGSWKGTPTPKAGEWIMNDLKIPIADYETLVGRFNPVDYEPRAWARLARNAGMKYVVITSKHHDGFALWDSRVSDYDVMATPYKRDLLKPLAEACRAEGLRFCTYHSIMDWHHPDYLPRRAWDTRPESSANFDRYVSTYLKAQLKEIVDGYDPAVLWFDGEWENTWTHERGADLYDYVRGLKHDILINNRVDKGRRGMEGLNREGTFKGDFGTPEQQIPANGLPGVDWESCMTMNDTWGFKTDDHNWKSAATLIRNVVDTASKGGNFLLNVGPTAEGRIPDASIERLETIGQWMAVNGDAIHGSTASPIGAVPWGRATRKGATTYLHVFDWPADGRLQVPLTSRVSRATLLADPARTIRIQPADTGVTLQIDGPAPDMVASVIRLTI
jgi:alpha-L-fucosidase